MTHLLNELQGNDASTLLSSRLSSILDSAFLDFHVYGCILRYVKAKKKIDAGCGKLEKELREGLLFLLRQAQVLIYNARVDRINQEGGKPQTVKEVLCSSLCSPHCGTRTG